MTPPAARTTVVIATRNRAEELCGTLERLTSLPERPAVTVVDNASTDGTLRRIGPRFPSVRLVGLPDNRGAAARTVGARLARTPFVAFCDDDSWWSDSSLERAVECLSRAPRLALVAARPLVEPDGTSDPVVRRLAGSPLPCRPGTPGPAVLGFTACAAVVRRAAYLGVGGFHPLLFLGGEERLLSYDLAAAGWDLAYREDVVAHHRPPRQRDASARRALDLRNEALIGWMRRPVGRALGLTSELARRAGEERTARRAFASLCAALPLALRERREVPREVEKRIRMLEAFERTELADARV